eukprot:TRINITY_DN6055_c0_g1_i5.p1 TRINITY_DN6055_c0_g1~~TRINITY_DN6055_c0_g1_i5.p1  ORF type:complete len:256 (+),score=33.72 TRINITY_DN6055_c0_g1_i5:189-956(+)
MSHQYEKVDATVEQTNFDLDIENGSTEPTEDAGIVNRSGSTPGSSGREEKITIISPMEIAQTKKHYGSHIPFLFIKGEPFFTIGPHCELSSKTLKAIYLQCYLDFSLPYKQNAGPFFLCMFSFLVGIGITIAIYIAPFHENANLVVPATIFVTLFEGGIYLLTALRNPGILSSQSGMSNESALINNPNYCRICKILRPENAFHCTDCEACIEQWDHHCPWTGKCIGKGNIVPFYTFILSTMCFMMYCIFVSVNLF